MAKEHDKNPFVLPNNEFKASTSQGLLCECEHKDSQVNYFGLGLCESCYKDESGIFSDIDDEEVDGYLFNEEEMHYRSLILENQYQENEEKAAEEAVAAAKKEFYEAISNKCMEDVLEARKHYESAVVALANFRKEMKQRRAQQAKTKSLGDEVDFDRLEKLFEHEPADEEHY